MFPHGRHLHLWPERCREAEPWARRAGKNWAKHCVAVAVSCCLEMALWRTLWMADWVSRMASGGLSASVMRFLNELFGVVSTAACSLQDERNKIDVWISIKFDVLCSLGIVSWASAGCCNEGLGLLGNGQTMATPRFVVVPILIKDEIHACVSTWPLTARVRAGMDCSMYTVVPLCECITSAKQLATAACLRSTPPLNRQPQQRCC